MHKYDKTKRILGESSESKLELKTPEIIQMFTNKSTNGLRQKLSEIERDLKVGKITKMEHERSKLEIFKALLKLNQITEAEKKYLIETNPDLLSVDSNDTIEDVSKVFSVIQKSWEICRIKYLRKNSFIFSWKYFATKANHDLKATIILDVDCSN